MQVIKLIIFFLAYIKINLIKNIDINILVFVTIPLQFYKYCI